MTTLDHGRAIELITRRGTEDMAAANADWLALHLARCAECAGYAAAFEDTGRWLRAVAVTATPALVNTTQARLRVRAAHLREQRFRMVLIAISFCLGALSSTLSAWLWWRFGGWIAARVGLPQAVVEPGILLFLVFPAIVIGVLLLAFPQPAWEGSLPLTAAARSEGESR